MHERRYMGSARQVAKRTYRHQREGLRPKVTIEYYHTWIINEENCQLLFKTTRDVHWCLKLYKNVNRWDLRRQTKVYCLLFFTLNRVVGVATAQTNTEEIWCDCSTFLDAVDMSICLALFKRSCLQLYTLQRQNHLQVSTSIFFDNNCKCKRRLVCSNTCTLLDS